jgi:hypothetical protein
MANPLECQVAALKNIVRIQDELLKDRGSCAATVWRNETYKLSVQNKIINDECVAIGKELLDRINRLEEAVVERDKELRNMRGNPEWVGAARNEPRANELIEVLNDLKSLEREARDLLIKE